MGSKGAPGILQLEARDATKHPNSAQNSRLQQKYIQPNVSSAMVEKLYAKRSEMYL